MRRFQLRIRPLLRGAILSAVLLGAAGPPGCARFRYQNSTALIERHIRASCDPTAIVVLKTIIFYPARDLLTLDPLWRRLFGDEAWNADGSGVADSSFYTNRLPEDLTPRRVAAGACTMPPPEPPFTVTRVESRRTSHRFFGTDARGRKFLFKLDHRDYPELGTTAAIVGSRILWALGYNTPPIFLVRIEGTGDARFDGRRAAAALLIDDVIGHFRFDWFRYRREVRGLRLACAWINDTDRVGTNTLVSVRNGKATYYLIDFDSCLGSWQARPKEPWRGYRHQGNLGWALLQLLSFGLLHPEPRPAPPVVSPAVGRFHAQLDPLRWRSQLPNTAFDHATPADLRWMIGKIRPLGRPHIEAIVAEARLSDPEDARYLVDILMRRREKIVRLDAP